MSSPVERFFCNECDYESSNTVKWGHFFYVLNHDSKEIFENIQTLYGWCYECCSIVPIEKLFKIDGLLKEKDERLDEYNNFKQMHEKYKNKFFQTSSTKESIEFYRIEIQEYENKQLIGIDLLIKNVDDFNREPICMICGCSEIKSLNVPNLESFNQYAVGPKDIKKINFEHPGCNGEIMIENLTLRLSIEYPERFYSTQGVIIQNSDAGDIGLRQFEGLEHLTSDEGGPTL